MFMHRYTSCTWCRATGKVPYGGVVTPKSQKAKHINMNFVISLIESPVLQLACLLFRGLLFDQYYYLHEAFRADMFSEFPLENHRVPYFLIFLWESTLENQ
jgi:hypothetical protein